MKTYLLRRILLSIPILLGVSLLVFSMIHLLPGDPVQLMFAMQGNSNPAQMNEFRHRMGLDQPLVIQYGRYLLSALHGDLGTSITNQQAVLQKIGEQLMPSIELAIGGMVVAIVIGLGLGLIAGARPNTWLDSFATTVSLLGVSTPGFLTAFFLIFVFSLRLRWLPSVGTDGFDHLILPALALGFGYAAILTRLLRGGLIEVGGLEYILAARGRGLPPRRILFRHMLRNALIPIVTFLALQFGSMVGGAVLIESIFGRQGIGHLLVDAILSRDYPVVQGIVLLIAVTYVFANLLVDACYGLIDPRIRQS
jgi:ABC-type dipeptide/oligopeptide/nickel transport system permease component